MAIQSDLLTTAAAKPASIVRRLTAVFAPLMLIGLLLFYGILPAVLQQARIATSQPLKLFSLWAWRDAILGASMPILLDSSDKNWAPVKEALLREAQGDILEVGAGSGATVRYYDAQSVRSLTLLEPFDALRAPLRTAVQKARLDSKAKILPIGIEKRSELAAKGVRPGTYDTVVLVQVLCSIPNPQSHLKYLQSLLKPGGKLLLFEHVRSTSLLTHAQQTAWTYPVWKFAAAGCCFDRDSARWVRDVGGWSAVSIARPVSEDVAELVPHAVAVYTKA